MHNFLYFLTDKFTIYITQISIYLCMIDSIYDKKSVYYHYRQIILLYKIWILDIYLYLCYVHCMLCDHMFLH